jgi:xanthine dehydrogenase iron-sulfur cluster and FAD-binding subunit A
MRSRSSQASIPICEARAVSARNRFAQPARLAHIANGSDRRHAARPDRILAQRSICAAAARAAFPLEDYFIAYGKQDRRRRFVTGIGSAQSLSMAFRCYKISSVSTQDISVSWAFCFEMADGRLRGSK